MPHPAIHKKDNARPLRRGYGRPVSCGETQRTSLLRAKKFFGRHPLRDDDLVGDAGQVAAGDGDDDVVADFANVLDVESLFVDIGGIVPDVVFRPRRMRDLSVSVPDPSAGTEVVVPEWESKQARATYHDMRSEWARDERLEYLRDLDRDARKAAIEKGDCPHRVPLIRV